MKPVRILVPASRAFAVMLVMLTAGQTYAQEGVILLHGLCRTKSSMANMEKALQAAGFIVENIEYPSRTAGIDQLADATISNALARATFRNCRRIHFVTHSLGGILVRSYFSRHTNPRLGRVVMLGPPNQGSEVVDNLGSWWMFRKLNGPAGNQLGTGTNSTPNRLGPVNFELGVIAGDRSINWINSLMIHNRDDGKVSIERTRVQGMKEHLVVHVSHPYLMKREKVIEPTIRFLQTGSFSNNPATQAN